MIPVGHAMVRRVVRLAAVTGLAAVVTAAGACGRLGNRFVNRVDSAGVEIVHNTSPDRQLGWRFVERRRIASGGLPLGPGLVGADSAGNLYLLDRARSRIVVIDSTGDRTDVGGGVVAPALNDPVSIAVSPDGIISVYDVGTAALLEGGRSGGWTTRNVVTPGRWEWRVVAVGASVVGVLRSTGNELADRSRRLAWATDADTTVLAALPWRTATLDWPACGLTLTVEPLFSPPLAWDIRDSLVAVSAGPGYVVNWFVGGTWRRSVRRAVAGREVTGELATREAAAGMAVSTPGDTCTGDPARQLAVRGRAAQVAAVYGVALSSDGTMWVTRGHLLGEAPPIDVFAATGAYLGTVPPGSPVPIGFTPGGDVLAADPATGGPEQLVLYGVEGRR